MTGRPDAPSPAAGQTLVVKMGGTTIAEEHDLLRELAAVRATRPVVVVHGGGKRLSQWLERLGVESRFEAGLRVTDDAAIEVVLAVLGGLVNGELVIALRAMGSDAVGLRGIDGGLLRGPREEGLGRVVTAPSADEGILEVLLAAGRLPVVAPLGLDEDGRICNVNADAAAAAISAALGGELVLLTDTDGVRDAAGERIPELTADEAERLIRVGVIAAGMVPKVRSALRALATGSGARRAVIADGRRDDPLRHALDELGGTSFRTA